MNILDGTLPEKVDMPVLLMVSQSCSEPETPAGAVLKTRLPPCPPAPVVSCITEMPFSVFSKRSSAQDRSMLLSPAQEGRTQAELGDDSWHAQVGEALR